MEDLRIDVKLIAIETLLEVGQAHLDTNGQTAGVGIFTHRVLHTLIDFSHFLNNSTYAFFIIWRKPLGSLWVTFQEEK